MMSDTHPTGQLAELLADQLAHPQTIPRALNTRDWWRQSLAHGAPGITLLHIERAAAGAAPWQGAHDWLTDITRAAVTAGPDSHLFYGAPALAHVLACAATARPGCYQRALQTLDHQIAKDTRRRIDDAHARIDSGRLPALAEFDVIRGLTGIGAHLMRRDPHSATVRAVLEYLVRLTESLPGVEQPLPGWWTATGPSGRDSQRFPAGHGNCGVAHGIGGPLALLALAARRGVTVDGHPEAIGRICTWLDRWRTDTDSGPVWPYWVTHAQLRVRQPDGSPRQRPSWCYGTAGLARAQQLAALATGDTSRQHLAERALIQALSNPIQLAAATDTSLCHGYAGYAHIAVTAAVDASPGAAAQLYALVPGLLDAVLPDGTGPRNVADVLFDADRPGLLEGAAGIALAASAASTATLPRTGWDTCLLIT